MLRRALGPEEVDLGAEAEDEIVIGDRLELVEADLAPVEVDGGDRRPDERSCCRGARAGRGGSDRPPFLDQTARELVEQRLEGVVVVAVDEHDVGVCVLELLRCADPGEAAAEDEDAWACGRHQPTPHLVAGDGAVADRQLDATVAGVGELPVPFIR